MASKRRVPPVPPVSRASPSAAGSSVWAWLRDDTNRTILAWLGSGLVALASGFWVFYQYQGKLKEPTGSTSPIASHRPVPDTQIVTGRDLTIGGDLNISSLGNQPTESSPQRP